VGVPAANRKVCELLAGVKKAVPDEGILGGFDPDPIIDVGGANKDGWFAAYSGRPLPLLFVCPSSIDWPPGSLTGPANLISSNPESVAR